ncbi:MAG: hypothetical protein AB7F89_08050, partial [Pirellulaceae bacterium]
MTNRTRSSNYLILLGSLGGVGIALAISTLPAAPPPTHASPSQDRRPEDSPSAKAVEPAPPLFEGLDASGRKITTSSAQAQQYFDQGLGFLYAFNHDEAIRSFREAARLDPQCAMAWWGVALANGPHINNPVLPEHRARAAWQAWTEASRHAASGSAVERALIEALRARYADPPPEDRQQLDEAYAGAMRRVWQQHSGDADVGALFAEALMDLRPWDLYTQDGQAQPGTDEVVATLERVLALAPRHPLALHLYIHAVEASTDPGRADDEADRLRDLLPGLGHLVHMPSHIDVRRGRWREALAANEKAIRADERYHSRSPQQDFYRLYMAHNRHMLTYAAMMRGQSELAVSSINAMVREIPESWLRENASFADGFAAMPLEVLVRFGRWDEVLAASEPADYLPFSRAMWRCARGIAYAARGDVVRARAEQEAFARARAALPADARFGNNAVADLMGVAEHLLDGEIRYRAGEVEAGLAALREAVRREDLLRYDEPPDWIHPVRHALGAFLLQEQRYGEAEQVYRADLA